MYGAILGDMVGAPYEFDQGNKVKKFPLFCERSQFTDDTVMTIAVAEALMDSEGKSDEEVKAALISSMQRWGNKYPNAGYGEMFTHWLRDKNPKPYNSFGNGAAMRVSSVGWLYDTIEKTRKYARLTAEVTHNHPEGIKGAEATASAIFLARNFTDMHEIKEYIIREFNYDLSRTCDEIRPGYHHVESCQETVPEAITAFLEGTDCEDVIRTAVSLGGDCDTLACIAGGIAEAWFDVEEELKNECRKRLPDDILQVLDRFDDNALKGPSDGKALKKAIRIYNENRNEFNRIGVFGTLCYSYVWISWDNNWPCFVTKDGKKYLAVFGNEEEMGECRECFSKKQKHFLDCINMIEEYDINDFVDGIIVNAFSEPFVVSEESYDTFAEIII